MGRPLRHEQFQHDEIAIVHCVQRCVRRAFLAGVDAVSGKDYSHRREWIRRRFEALASVFVIDILSYAILSNHLHVILRNRPDVLANLSDEEVAIRWLRVFPGRRIEEQLAEPSEIDVQRILADPEQVAKIRSRLTDISWFMRALAEPIARIANRQDECTGRFWEGRFKAQRIVDDAGLLACAMYVDLNPVRAAMASSPEESVHTSAYDRIKAEKGIRIPSAAFDLVPITQEESVTQRRKSLDEQREDRKAKRKRNAKQVPRDSWLSPLSLSAEVQSSDPQVLTDKCLAPSGALPGTKWRSRGSPRGARGPHCQASLSIHCCCPRLNIPAEPFPTAQGLRQVLCEGSRPSPCVCQGGLGRLTGQPKTFGNRYAATTKHLRMLA